MIFLAMAMSQNGKAAKATGMSKIDCLPAQPPPQSVCFHTRGNEHVFPQMAKRPVYDPLEDSCCKMPNYQRILGWNQYAMNGNTGGEGLRGMDNTGGVAGDG